LSRLTCYIINEEIMNQSEPLVVSITISDLRFA
jgi:hypothetical protein